MLNCLNAHHFTISGGFSSKESAESHYFIHIYLDESGQCTVAQRERERASRVEG